MLQNGDFSAGWTDMPPAAGFLINQQPFGWTLRWVEPGESLFGVGDTAGGAPECVHKLREQLPPNEQPGGSDPLILAGEATYKIFNATAPFGAELRQTVAGLEPGSEATLTVPVRVHLHGETDPFGAESGVWVNGEGEWANADKMGDREWYEHEVDFTVPADGKAEIAIRVKSKWPRPKDFFVDNVQLEATPAADDGNGEAGGGEVGAGQKVLQVTLPRGVTLETAVGDDPAVAHLTVPPGVQVEVTRT